MGLTPSSVTQRCKRHNRFPDVSVCKACLVENEDRRQALEAALTGTPKIILELFNEGRLYLTTLQHLQEALKAAQAPRMGLETAPRDSQIDGYLAEMRLLVDEALTGHETRILSAKVPTVDQPAKKSSFASKLLLPPSRE